MTTSSAQCVVTANGNGATTMFAYDFLIPMQPDGVNPAVFVQLENTATGQITSLTWSLDYTITGVGNANGGEVTYPLSGSPLAVGNTITIARALEYLQPIAVSNVSFYPHVVEVSADNLSAQIQQLAADGSRALRVPLGEVSPALPGAAARALKFLYFDGSGNATPVTEGPAYIPLLQTGLYVNVKDFGAKGDGAHDDTTAILTAEASCGPGVTLFFPSGTYVFTAALSSLRQRFSWQGCGFGQSILLYKGASTTINLFTLGDGVTPILNASMDGLAIQSTTVMTAGCGAHINAVARSVINVQLMGQDGYQQLGNNLWNGAWFEQASSINWGGLECFAQNEGIMVNGGSLGNDSLFIPDGSKIAQCYLGIHCGGGFGGLFVGQVNLEINFCHIKVDQALVAIRNREIFINGSLPDVTTGGPGIWLADPGGPTTQMTGPWISSAVGGPGVLIDAVHGAGYTIISGGQIFNNAGDGVQVNSASHVVSIFATEIIANGGWGINPTVANNNVSWNGIQFSGNTLGTYNPTHVPVGSYPDLGYTATIAVLQATMEVQVGDDQFYMEINTGQPVISFKADSYLSFNRTALALNMVVNSVGSFIVGQGYHGPGTAQTTGTLAVAATAGEGARAFVTDATLAYNGTNIGSAYVGSSTHHTWITVIGGAWVIG